MSDNLANKKQTQKTARMKSRNNQPKNPTMIELQLPSDAGCSVNGGSVRMNCEPVINTHFS